MCDLDCCKGGFSVWCAPHHLLAAGIVPVQSVACGPKWPSSSRVLASPWTTLLLLRLLATSRCLPHRLHRLRCLHLPLLRHRPRRPHRRRRRHPNLQQRKPARPSRPPSDQRHDAPLDPQILWSPLPRAECGSPRHRAKRQPPSLRSQRPEAASAIGNALALLRPPCCIQTTRMRR